MAQEAALETVALVRLHFRRHFVGDVEAVDVEEAVQGPQVRPVQRLDGELDLEELGAELEPHHLRHVLLLHHETLVALNPQVERLVVDQEAREPQPAQDVELRQVDHNRRVIRVVARVDQPRALEGRLEGAGEARSLDDSIPSLQSSAACRGDLGVQRGDGAKDTGHEGHEEPPLWQLHGTWN